LPVLHATHPISQRRITVVDDVRRSKTATQLARQPKPILEDTGVDAPEIDGTVRIAKAAGLAVGSMVAVEIVRATEHDLIGRRT
jgi:hypothetical protein